MFLGLDIIYFFKPRSVANNSSRGVGILGSLASLAATSTEDPLTAVFKSVYDDGEDDKPESVDVILGSSAAAALGETLVVSKSFDGNGEDDKPDGEVGKPESSLVVKLVVEGWRIVLVVALPDIHGSTHGSVYG